MSTIEQLNSAVYPLRSAHLAGHRLPSASYFQRPSSVGASLLGCKADPRARVGRSLQVILDHSANFFVRQLQ